MGMRSPWARRLFTLVWSTALFGADERHLAQLRDAQAAFDRVALNPAPQLADASACVQAQAAMLSVALPAEESELHYRKGFCELAVAAVTRDSATFTDAATQLDQSHAFMLAWIARQAGDISSPAVWVQPDNCPASCQPFVPAASLWLGSLALGHDDLDAAARHFSALPESGWPAFVVGMRAFQAARYAEAATRYGEALHAWTHARSVANPPLALRLAPPADIPQLLTELGGAQLLSGDPKTAVATLDLAVNMPSPAAKTFFLRARAEELAGRPEPALADYNLASRAAFANATDLASGEAHLYRGIVFYRRKDYQRAEQEFSSALNFEISPVLHADASAWRHLSAVASGFCGASRQYLEQSLPAVSPYFPKDEARAVAAGCPAGVP